MKKLAYLERGMEPVWTDEFCAQICGLLQQKYVSFLDKEFFELLCNHNDEQVQIKITLCSSDKNLVYPIEGVCVLSEHDQLEAEDLALLMLDYLDAYWNEYLSEGRDTYFLMDWSAHEYKQASFYLRGFVRNLKLEQEADKLLEQDGPGEHLIHAISSET